MTDSTIERSSSVLAPTRPALTVRGLTKSYGAARVLDDAELDVSYGQVVAVLGANGSGKSTLLRCVVGLTEPDGGDIAVMSPAGDRDRAAMVFQQIHLVKRRSVLDNVCTGALARMPRTRSWAPWTFPRKIREEAMGCLDRVGLAARAHERAHRLSGGQQQRVAVARALCQGSRVLLADEPVSALDPAAAEQVMTLLRSLAHDDGIAVAAVLHQPDLARRFGDRVVGLVDGRVAFEAAAAGLTQGAVSALYAADRAVLPEEEHRP